MSSSILLSRKPDSNRRPIHYEWIALPTELFRQYIVFLKCDAKVVNIILMAKYFAYFFYKAVIFMSWRLSLVLKSSSDCLWSWHKQWCTARHFPFRETCSLFIDCQRKGEISFAETSRSIGNLFVFSF